MNLLEDGRTAIGLTEDIAFAGNTEFSGYNFRESLGEADNVIASKSVHNFFVIIFCT
jgi:hypothetical protein